ELAVWEAQVDAQRQVAVVCADHVARQAAMPVQSVEMVGRVERLICCDLELFISGRRIDWQAQPLLGSIGLDIVVAIVVPSLPLLFSALRPPSGLLGSRLALHPP